jgi:peroxiredoxin
VAGGEDPGSGIPSAMPDEGIVRRLVGASVPPLTLGSTAGPVRVDELAARVAVIFVYPHATGLPDAPVQAWEDIPGARGCTAQACGFRDQHDRLVELGASLAGLSVQTVEEHRAFAERVGIRYPLLSDPTLALASALDLPTFTAEGRTFYRRLTLVADGGRVVEAFGPIRDPARNPSDVAAWLDRRTPR